MAKNLLYFLLLSMFTSMLAIDQAVAANKKPNIVVIFGDDIGLSLLLRILLVCQTLNRER